MTTTEVWIFGGSRVDSLNRHAHAWLPVGTKQVLWFPVRGSHSVGYEYRVQVTRAADGQATKHGEPVLVDRHGDDALCAKLAADHGAATARLRMLAAERIAWSYHGLAEAVDPLTAILRTAELADRDAILAYVMRRLTRAG